MSEQLVVGIDWGTTNWEVGRITEDGRPEVIKTASGKRKTESAIYFPNGDQPLFGSQARRMAPIEPDRVLHHFKPELDEDGHKFSVNGREIKPLELTTLSYKEIKARVEEELGKEINRAVITVPAYFHNVGYGLMKEGAEEAGFKVERVLREPASAAIGYALDRPFDRDETVLVYDLGGGTFDVSVLKVGEEDGLPDIQILGNSGDTHLGGRDFDRLILNEIFLPKFKQEHGFDPTEDPHCKDQWLEDAERVKKDLSTAKKSTIYLQGKGEALSLEVTREQFNSLIDCHVNHSLDTVKDLLADISVNKQDIDRLVFAGGSTRIKLVRDKITEFMDLEPASDIDPDMAVTIGAAVIAGAKGNQVIRNKDGQAIPYISSKVTDVTSHALGVKAVEEDTGQEYNQIIVDKHHPLPAAGSQIFRPTKDDAAEVEITILQGESRDLDQCRILQEGYKLGISKPRAASQVEIEVEFIVNKDGLIEIAARTDDGDQMKEEFKHPDIFQT